MSLKTWKDGTLARILTRFPFLVEGFPLGYPMGNPFDEGLQRQI